MPRLSYRRKAAVQKFRRSTGLMIITSLRWQFPISANYSWFDSFAHNNAAGDDFTIIRDVEDDMPPAYGWASHHLDDLTDPQAVLDRAVALKALYDGAMVISHGHHRQPFTELYDVTERTTIRDVAGDFLSYPFSARQIARTGSSADFDNAIAAGVVASWIFLARYDDAARGILAFLGVNGPTWISLYACKDYVAKQGGWDESQMALATGKPKAEFERFRQTANNAAAIGPFARHGELGWKPPLNPMTLEEASDLIRLTVRRFLRQRSERLMAKLKSEEQCPPAM